MTCINKPTPLEMAVLARGLDPRNPVVAFCELYYANNAHTDWNAVIDSDMFQKWYALGDSPVSLYPSIDNKAASYMHIAEAFASRSKDPSTKVGAVILDMDMSVRAQGWNGAARGSSADQDSRFDRPEKYYWSIHAEQNAIANAARVGVPLNGCTLVVTHPPCMVCSNLIVASGIKTVITKRPTGDFSSRWSEDMLRSQILFREVHVRLLYVGGDNVEAG